MNLADTINQWSLDWFEFMQYRVLDSILVLLLIGGLWLLVRKKVSPQLGYVLFLLILFKLIIPSPISISTTFPSFPVRQEAAFIPTSVENDITQKKDIAQETASSAAGQENISSITSQKQDEALSGVTLSSIVSKPTIAKSSFTSASWLMITWGIIVSLLLFRFLGFQWMIHRKLRNAQHIDSNSIPVDLIQLQKKSKTNRRIVWLQCSWTKTPVVWGFLKPRIIVPAELFRDFRIKQIEWILLHELAHVRRFDNIASMFQGVIQILFFFHPGVWLANRMIDQQREYACDDMALSVCDAPRVECGEGLLSIAKQVNGAPSYMMAHSGFSNKGSLVRRRMMRILDMDRKLNARLSITMTIVLLFVACLVLPTVRAGEKNESIPTITGQDNKQAITLRKINQYRDIKYNYSDAACGRLSWNGQYAVFLERFNKKPRTVLIDVKTGDKKYVFPEDQEIIPATPILSPNADRMVYLSDDDYKTIYMADTETGKQKVLLKGVDDRWYKLKQWTNDGKRILIEFCFKDNKDKNEFAFYNVDTGSKQTVGSVKDVKECELSPDGRYLLFDKYNMNVPQGKKNHRDIYIYDIANKIEIPLFNSPAEECILGWSPDGCQVVYTSRRNERTDLFYVPFSEGKLTGLPTLVRGKVGTIYPLGSAKDGTFLYYHMTDYDSDIIYISTLDREEGLQMNYVPYASGKKPFWSPEGDRFIFQKHDGKSNNYLYYIQTIATQETTEIVSDFNRDFPFFRLTSLAFLQSGKEFLCHSYLPKEPKYPSGAIFRVNIETGKVEIHDKLNAQPLFMFTPSKDESIIYYLRGMQGRVVAFKDLVRRNIETDEEKVLMEAKDGLLHHILPLSPNGEKILVAIWKQVPDDPNGQKHHYNLWILSTDGATSSPLTCLDYRLPVIGMNGNVDWYDDSTLIAVKNTSFNSCDVYLISIHEDKIVKTWSYPFTFSEFDFNPITKQLIFTRAQDQNNFHFWTIANFLPKE